MTFDVPGCTGVTVEPLPPIDGEHALLVKIAVGGEIPMHTHAVASSMQITRGSARCLGKSQDRIATAGDNIFKPAGMPHGFTDIGPEGFEFISTADGAGILHNGGEWDFELEA